MRWSAQIHTEFHVHRVTWDAPRRFEVFAYPAVTVFGSSFQGILLTRHLSHRGPATPGGQVPPV